MEPIIALAFACMFFGLALAFACMFFGLVLVARQIVALKRRLDCHEVTINHNARCTMHQTGIRTPEEADFDDLFDNPEADEADIIPFPTETKH